MVSPILLCILGAILVYRIYKYMFVKPPNFPPGPPRLPYLGSYILMLLINSKHMHRAADVLCRYYKSNVLGMYFGSLPAVILNDNESVRKALMIREFDGRPGLLLAQLRSPDFKVRGIFFTEGDKWLEQRRYMLRYLRDFGFGRRFEELELEIRDEFKAFIDILKNGPEYSHEKNYFKDGLVQVPGAFCVPFLNIFLKVLFNERLPRNEQHLIYEMIQPSIDFIQIGDSYGNIFSHSPIMSKLFPKMSKYEKLRDVSMQFHTSVKKLVDRQIETYDKHRERSFLDMYITEINKAKECEEENTTFTYDQLLLNVTDFMAPPLVANSMQTTQILQVLCARPDVQKKIQDEIDHVVGQGCLPRLDDRINLPYTEATIREVMRYHTLLPNSVVHTAMESAEFLGYDIPKGCFVLPCLYSSHRDPKVWKDPQVFSPERFLDENGKFSLKKDHSTPFGAGRRLCAGETFARNSIFLFLTALLQNFTVRAPDNQTIPNLKNASSGIFTSSPNFWLKFEAR